MKPKNEHPSTTKGRGWVAANACGTGSAHIAQGKPCQDAVCALAGPLPFVIASDGRGSAQRSELGSAAGVAAFAALVKRDEGLIRDILGTGRRRNATRPLRWRNFVRNRVIPGLQEELVRLSSEYGLPAKEFEFTVAGAIVGPCYLGWFQIGDSGLVAVRSGRAIRLHHMQSGRYLNETCFVSVGMGKAQAVCGIVPKVRTNAIFAYTDGATARLFNSRNQSPGPAFVQLAKLMGSGKWTGYDLSRLMQDASWMRSTDDDHSLAILCYT